MTEDLNEIENEARDVADVASLANSKGGRKLVETLYREANHDLKDLFVVAKENPKLENLLSIIFRLEMSYGLINRIQRDKNKFDFLSSLIAEANKKEE